MLTIPGTFVTQHSGGQRPTRSSSGGSTRARAGPRALGGRRAPVNQVSNVHGQGYADLHFVMPEVVEQVEALPGPSSPDQGDFAVAARCASGSATGSQASRSARASAPSGPGAWFLAYPPRGPARRELRGVSRLGAADGFGVGRASRRAWASRSGCCRWATRRAHRLGGELRGPVSAPPGWSVSTISRPGRVERSTAPTPTRAGTLPAPRWWPPSRGSDGAYRYALAPTRR
jgi:hypothetical protein